MKSRVFQALSLSGAMLYSLAALGQLDSSSAVLLRPNGRGPTPQSLDNTRYKIRAPEPRRSSDDVDEQPGTYIPSPVPKNSKETAAKVSTSTPVVVESPVAQPTPIAPVEAPAVVLAPSPAPTPPPLEERPPVTTQVRELILGGTNEDIDDAKRQIHPEDPRANILNISVAPAYFYDGSSSNYSFRNYHSDGPGLGLGMSVWLTPFFGVQSKYFTSVSAAVNDGGNVVPMNTQEFEAGIRFRRHFGYSRKSAQMSWGIDYRDSANKISPDAKFSVGRKTSGLSVGVEGEIPLSVTYAHLFEVAIRPFQHHSEMSTTSDARSGTKNETNGVSLSLGGQWTLDRRNQIFWKAQYSVEKSIFSGAASLPDSHTGATPTGVGVTNSLGIIYFGFKWGS